VYLSIDDIGNYNNFEIVSSFGKIDYNLSYHIGQNFISK
jgi:hypothetical protein